jgi:hypothetical protein
MKRYSARRARKAIKRATEKAMIRDIPITSSALAAVYSRSRRMLAWEVDDWTWAAYHDVQEFTYTKTIKHKYVFNENSDSWPMFERIDLPKEEWRTYSSSCYTHNNYYHAYDKHWWEKNPHRYSEEALKQFRK